MSKARDLADAGNYDLADFGDFDFPASDGSSGQVLQTDGSGNLSFADAAVGGKILQVVQAVKNDTSLFTNTGSWADISHLSLSITPSSASNKIYLMAHVVVGSSSGVSLDSGLRFLRNSTAIGLGDSAGSRTRATSGVGPRERYELNSNTMLFLDSPSSTSATTYKVQLFKPTSAAGTVYINREFDDTNSDSSFRTISNLIAMEVSA